MKKGSAPLFAVSLIALIILFFLLILRISASGDNKKVLPDTDIGVLVLAHGSDKEWNDVIIEKQIQKEKARF